MIPIKNIENIVKSYESLEKDLASGKIDRKDFVKKSKEYSNIKEIIKSAKEYLSFQKDKSDLEKIINDKNSEKEIIELAQNENLQLLERHKKNEKNIKLFLLPKDEVDTKNAIVEIRAGTGGLEASLFASDLFKMYEKVCIKNSWEMEIISISKRGAGGFKEVIFLIKGNNIYSTLKFESGVHRVQRIPTTETQGRVHTSASGNTATVAADVCTRP
jgi:peptide chain release factor 1